MTPRARWSPISLILMLGSLLIAGPLVGCESDDGLSLWGSVSAVYDLDFVETRARLTDESLSIEYVDGNGIIAVEIIARTVPDGPASIDLATDGDIRGSRGGSNLPARTEGWLVLLDYEPTAGAPVIGTFEAVLTNGDEEFTLYGAFETSLIDDRTQ